MNLPETEYLTTMQVAQLLGVSTRRVVQLADRLPHKRVGAGSNGMRLYDPDGVRAFMAGREVEPETAA